MSAGSQNRDGGHAAEDITGGKPSAPGTSILDYLLNKYGPILLINVLHTTQRALENRIYSGLLDIPTYREGGVSVLPARKP